MADIDPTPETPTTIGDRLAWWRGEQATHFAQLLGTPPSNLGAIAALIADLRGTKTVADIDDTLRNALFTQGEPTQWPYLLSLDGRLADIQERLDNIQQVLGAEPYMSTETANIRAILLNIMNGASQFGIVPDGDILGYVSSTGTYAENGRRYIVFQAFQGGIISAENGQMIRVTPQTNWDGYYIYIQTDAPDAMKHNVNVQEYSINPFPVNSWVPFSSTLYADSTHTFKFSVESIYNARAYIRIPSTHIYTISSRLYQTNGGSYLYYGSWWPNGFTTSNVVNGVTYNPAVHTTINLSGSTIQLISGSNVNVSIKWQDGTSLTQALTSATYVFPKATALVSLYSPKANGQFTAQLVSTTALV